MNGVMTLVRNLVCYALSLTMIMQLLGKSSYTKYIRLFTGFLFLLLVLTPVFRVFQVQPSFLYHLNRSFFDVQTRGLKEEFGKLEKTQVKKIQQQYEQKILQQIEKTVQKNGYFLIEGKINWGNHATLQQIHLTISKERTHVVEKPIQVSEIKEIKIESIINQEAHFKQTVQKNKKIENIRRQLEKQFAVAKKNIMIEID